MTPTRHPISGLYAHQPSLRDALVVAAALHDVAAIDGITDQLAALGLCRKRSDKSQLDALRAAGRRGASA